MRKGEKKVLKMGSDWQRVTKTKVEFLE